ncbi:MAG: hypothetical protein PHY04_00635 [Candidatus ainarchaeum sp.]|jgi:hypothetical protein|nr:hypothetical protein [Candidatus ainarchaeum sp.]MDD4467575.1 hypothetical protein [Candidatus ainarchaeum sp.]
MRNALNALSAKRLKMRNPFLKGVQKASDEARQRMIKQYEGERAKLIEARNLGLFAEDENLLYAGERKRMELEQRKEVGKTASYLMKKGYSRVHANALATAFGLEMTQLKKELSSQFGDVKANAVLREMRVRLLGIFKEPVNMGNLLRDVRTQEKQFSQSIFAQVREEVFQNYGIPI